MDGRLSARPGGREVDLVAVDAERDELAERGARDVTRVDVELRRRAAAAVDVVTSTVASAETPATTSRCVTTVPPSLLA